MCFGNNSNRMQGHGLDIYRERNGNRIFEYMRSRGSLENSLSAISQKYVSRISFARFSFIVMIYLLSAMETTVRDLLRLYKAIWCVAPEWLLMQN